MLAIGELDGEIELALTHSGGASDGGRHAAATGIGLNEHAVRVRADVRTCLVSLAQMIMEQRSVHAYGDTVPAIARFVASHCEWLAAHDAASEFSEELNQLRRAAWGAAYSGGTRVFPVGPCPTCAVVIRAMLRDDGRSTLRCDGDPPHEWSAAQWRNLGRRLVKQYLTVAEIATMYQLEPSSVRSAATRNQWQRVRVHGRTAYALVDVRATLD